ncbi:MAG: tRNA pseudouridine(55) synthase TruB [Clostridiales Family XIII bacterium]|jgi:tRNA pseudouridine55 synthase|nr:tRNA pseudouridine(55) synthase TruB [Clostridiales Family XIII bacterium]
MSCAADTMNGFVNLLKPSRMSSHDAVAFFRRISGIERVGHTGTLDPMAVGVLPLCVGKATRVMSYFAPENKRYRCEMKLGIVTNTQDVWGRMISRARPGFAKHLSERLITETAASFVGPQMQTPPLYSAVRIRGKRLYEYAREGETVVIPSRKIKIFSIKVKHFDSARAVVRFEAECSQGTYMRTLCHDWGRMLGCGAAMSGLIRMRSGVFKLEDAHTVEELAAAFSSEDLPEHILTPMDEPLRELPAVWLSAEPAGLFSNGMRIEPSSYNVAMRRLAAPRDFCRVYGDAGRRGLVFLGVGKFQNDTLCPARVFLRI